MFKKLTKAITKPVTETVKEEFTNYIPAITAIATLGILLLCAVPRPVHMVVNIYR